MRLKSIKLAGFKSFVDPTTVSFPSNLCAVVGPNGCGKSNIIDAVRWVMGESSAKNLRGEAMTDVIFNGSGNRKPIGQASIELIFDNSDATIVGEYAGYSEISIRRKVTRDSQNVYFLNGVKCRRRDITDIFLGTGLGPRSYAIIEQGMISRLIEAKPEELRIYIEEAAGISKYKERRRDTENRIRRTRENLERLEDIRDELGRQISRLERQAQSAEKYTEFKALERNLKAQLQAFRYRVLKEQSQALHAAIGDLEMDVEAKVTEQVSKDTAIEKYRLAYTEQGDRFNEVQGRFYSLGADISKLEQAIQYAKDRERQINLDLQQTERDCSEAKEHLLVDEQKAEGWQAELLEIEPELDLVRGAEEESSGVLIDAEEAMQAWQQEWDAFNQRASEPRQQAEVQQSSIKYLEQVQQRLVHRIEKLEEERSQFDALEGTRSEVDDKEQAIVALDDDIAMQNERLEQADERIAAFRDQQQQQADEQDKLRSDLQSARGRLSSLEALQQAAMSGSASEQSQRWLEKQGVADYPRLAEKLTVDTGWETAVEVVLGESLQAVCADAEMAQLVAGWSDFDKGKVTLLTAGLAANVSTDALTLSSKVRSELDISALLNGVFIAETVDEALAKQAGLAAGQSFVTRDGLWLGSNWLRLVKEHDASAGVIARKHELEQLVEKINDLEQAQQEKTDQLAELKQALHDQEAQRDRLRREINEHSRKHGDLRAQVSALRAKADQALESAERAARDIAEAKQQHAQESRNLVDARSQLESAIAAMENDSEERETLLGRRDTIRASLDGARQRARHDKDRAHELAMRHQSICTQLEAMKQGVQRLHEQLQRMETRKAQLQASLNDNNAPNDDAACELEALLEKRISVEDELTEARRAVESAESSLRETEQSRLTIEQGLIEARSKLETSRLQAQTLDVQGDGLKQQLVEEGFDVDTVLADIDVETDVKTLSEELERVANRISRLGPINLAAVEEFKTESERKQYLDSQNEDLQDALTTLEEAILKIDRETRTRFKETFDKINTGLQELFPKVFGGGHAYLELTGEDMLDTGIAIMARPPGKKNSTIHLLSGGEKALTAIALVFSIFRLNPAPFCMLDEVDAPLDDANVGRYARMVEAMSDTVQFIYITHNKIAMEMAHQLMGVTMHEPGVSRMVTVDVDEAAELAAV